jgi:uncharacterized membrane protein
VLGEGRPQAGPATLELAALQPGAFARSVGVWRDPVVWAAAVAVLGACCVISLVRLLRFEPASFDLGIFTEYVKQLAHLHAPVVDILGPGYNFIGNHFEIGLAVFAPLFRVFPSPATLLAGQAGLAAVSVFPVAAAGSAIGGRATGRLVGFAYGFSWGLQQLANFDFHEVALAVPLLAFSLSALVRRRPLAAIGWAMPLVFVKEDQGFTVAAIGLLLGVSAAFPPPPLGGWRARMSLTAAGFGTGPDGLYRDGRWGSGRVALWGGLFLLAWGLFWSVLAITVIIPHFNPTHDYAFWKDGGSIGGGQSFSVGGALGQTGAHWPAKLMTILMLLLPTAFAALGSPVALVALPSLALRFLSTDSAFWGTGWHYNAPVMPVLFVAAAEATGRLRGSPQDGAARGHAEAAGGLAGAARGFAAATEAVRGAIAGSAGAMMAAIAVVIAFHFPLSQLWHSSTFRPDPHAAAVRAALATVPDGVTVQSTLDVLAPLAARTDTFWMGTAGNPVTQYVVFDGANSGYSPAVTDVPAFIHALYPRDHYVQVFQRDDVYVFKLR